MAGTIAADLGFRVTQTGEFVGNRPEIMLSGDESRRSTGRIEADSYQTPGSSR
jgi:hypothetical protein